MQPTTSVRIEIPAYLKKVMNETMTTAVSHLYVQMQMDGDKIKDIFHHHVLKAPLNDNLIKEIKLEGNPLLGKEIEFLHKLYNDPDSSRVSAINGIPEALEKFHIKMYNSFKQVKKVCENMPLPSREKIQGEQPLPNISSPAQVDLSRFEAPSKDREKVMESDQELGRHLLEELDSERQVKDKRISHSSHVSVEDSNDNENSNDQDGHLPIKHVFEFNNSIINREYYKQSVHIGDNFINSFMTTHGDIIVNPTHNYFLPSAQHLKNSARQIKSFAGNSEVQRYSDSFQSDKVYNLKMNQPFKLTTGSSKCTINCGMGSHITIENHCEHVVINGGMNSHIVIAEHCKNIKINLGMGGFVCLGNNCTDIHINTGMNSNYKLGLNCRNIYVNGGKVA